ncbi:MAG: dihydrofolate reductase [Pseudomonadota bacterium]
MPWHVPADLAHFKQVTMGHPVMMGRKTFESIGRALPGRRNVVVSRTTRSSPDGSGVEYFSSIDAALQACAGGEIMVIGGGELYRQLLPQADRMELTLIDTSPAGDTRFPQWRPEDWHLHRMEVRPADERNAHRLVFCSFKRITMWNGKDAKG